MMKPYSGGPSLMEDLRDKIVGTIQVVGWFFLAYLVLKVIGYAFTGIL